MKREIKLRGKRLDNGKWVIGSLLQDDYGTCMIVEFVDHHEQWHEVDPETVGEYTGLKDKNGEDIYEGDILSDGRLFHIKWDSRGASWTGEMNNDPEQQLDLCFLITRKQTRVISNIHDNPELLKTE